MRRSLRLLLNGVLHILQRLLAVPLSLIEELRVAAAVPSRSLILLLHTLLLLLLEKVKLLALLLSSFLATFLLCEESIVLDHDLARRVEATAAMVVVVSLFLVLAVTDVVPLRAVHSCIVSILVVLGKHLVRVGVRLGLLRHKVQWVILLVLMDIAVEVRVLNVLV